MSHVKNVQAFGKLTGICTGYGGSYNPGQQNLQVEAMSTLFNIAQLTWEEMKQAQNAYDIATNNRKLGFKGIRKLSSAVYTMLKASGANALTLKDAAASLRKIYGSRLRKPEPATEAGGESTETRFVYGRDYITIADSVGTLLNLVQTESRYNPNEVALTVTGLQQRLAALKNLNAAVTQAEINLSKARKKRDALFYTGDGNLVSTGIAVKQYIRSVYGYRSPEHLEVLRVNFTKP